MAGAARAGGRRPYSTILAGTLLAVCLLLVPRSAGALGFYFLASLGETSAATDLGESFSQLVDGEDDSWSAGIGFEIGEYIAVQAEYHDFGSVPGFGSPCPSDEPACIEILVPIVADSDAISLSLLPHFSVHRWVALYGKLGYVAWESDVSEVLPGAERFIEEFDDQEFLWGAGVRVELPGPVDAFAEYQSFGDAFDSVSIGATLGF